MLKIPILGKLKHEIEITSTYVGYLQLPVGKLQLTHDGLKLN